MIASYRPQTILRNSKNIQIRFKKDKFETFPLNIFTSPGDVPGATVNFNFPSRVGTNISPPRRHCKKTITHNLLCPNPDLSQCERDSDVNIILDQFEDRVRSHVHLENII